MTIYEASLTIVGAFISGGFGVAIINRLGMTKKEKHDVLLMLVKQLQENVNTNNDEIKALKIEVLHWRDKYYAELEEKNKLATELRKLHGELRKFNQHQTT